MPLIFGETGSSTLIAPVPTQPQPSTVISKQFCQLLVNSILNVTEHFTKLHKVPLMSTDCFRYTNIRLTTMHIGLLLWDVGWIGRV